MNMINDAHFTHKKKNNNNNLSPDCEKRRKLVAMHSVLSMQRANEQRFANALGAVNPTMLLSRIIVNFISLFCTYVTIFNRKNVSQIYDNIICFNVISTNFKQILHLKPCIVWKNASND